MSVIQNFLSKFTKLINIQTTILASQKNILEKVGEQNESGLSQIFECTPCSSIDSPTPQKILQLSELNQIIRKLQSLTNIIRSASHLQTITTAIGSITDDLTKINQDKMDMTYFKNRFNNTLDFFSKFKNKYPIGKEIRTKLIHKVYPLERY